MAAKKYQNARDLLQACTGEDSQLANELDSQVSRRQLVRHFAILRDLRKVSQADVAKVRGCTQSAISKLENGLDSDVTLGDIEAYQRALGVTVSLVLHDSKPTLFDRIKWHAAQISACFKAIRARASRNKEFANEAATFHVEALVNLAEIVQSSLKKLPNSPAVNGIEIQTSSADLQASVDESSRRLAVKEKTLV